MKKQLLIFFLLCVSFGGLAQADNQYDSALAKKLQADDRGMKQYVLVILKTGKANNFSKPVLDSLFKGHLANIGRMADEGKLTLAGPFEKNPLNYRGLFVFNVATIEEAKTLVSTDPTVKADIFDVEYLEWYCSAALQEVSGLHKKIQKKSF